jgi:hypothetical protein
VCGESGERGLEGGRGGCGGMRDVSEDKIQKERKRLGERR